MKNAREPNNDLSIEAESAENVRVHKVYIGNFNSCIRRHMRYLKTYEVLTTDGLLDSLIRCLAFLWYCS